MSEITLDQSALQIDAEHETAFQQLLADMNRVEEQMCADSAESERIKMRTAIIKAETEIIKAHSEANLLRLEMIINQLSKAA